MKTSYMLPAYLLMLLFVLFLTFFGELKAQNTTWPQFSGLNSSGLADDNAKPPVQFGINQNLLWKVPLPVGHSSPCIWGDNIFLTVYIKDKKELQMIWEKIFLPPRR